MNNTTKPKEYSFIFFQEFGELRGGENNEY